VRKIPENQNRLEFQEGINLGRVKYLLERVQLETQSGLAITETYHWVQEFVKPGGVRSWIESCDMHGSFRRGSDAISFKLDCQDKSGTKATAVEFESVGPYVTELGPLKIPLPLADNIPDTRGQYVTELMGALKNTYSKYMEAEHKEMGRGQARLPLSLVDW